MYSRALHKILPPPVRTSPCSGLPTAVSSRVVHAGCAAGTSILACGSTQVPLYAVTYKLGLARGRHAPFGRISLDSIQPTVCPRLFLPI